MELDPRLKRKQREDIILEKVGFFNCQNHWKSIRVSKEHPISKGEEQYKTTIGFMDVFLECKHYISWEWHLMEDPLVCGKFEDVFLGHRRILFEVKTRLKVAEFLRQVKLYKEYTKRSLVVLVMTSPINIAQKETVESEGIRIIQLGSEFQDWKKQFLQKSQPASLPTF